MKEVLAEDISVGDLIYLEDNDMIPCDMVVLSTSQVESFQDFLIKLDMKPLKHLVEIRIFSLNNVIALSDLSKLGKEPTKIGQIFRK